MKNVVGVLALQGDVSEHRVILERLGAATREVRLPKDLVEIDRLIIPGGESTTIGKLLVMYELLEPIKRLSKKGMPLWGTCAGAILMAKHVADGRPGQPTLALMDITARRNAFGRQLDSFVADIAVPAVGKKTLSVAFIRAPLFENPGKGVDVLATLPNGDIVAARQGNLLITSFHPEITGETAIHKYFLSL